MSGTGLGPVSDGFWRGQGPHTGLPSKVVPAPGWWVGLGQNYPFSVGQADPVNLQA